jgi:hypothetical protein
VLADVVWRARARSGRRFEELGERRQHLFGQVHLAAGGMGVAGVKTQANNQSGAAKDGGIGAAGPGQDRRGAVLNDEEGEAKIAVVGGDGEAKVAQVSLQFAGFEVFQALEIR